MRRGLISHAKAELPGAVLDARLARLREAMGQAGLDALLVYTNNTRTAGVSWLTGFVPYWSEALLVVPRERAPVLIAALTYRVKSWIERTSRVAEVIHTPRIGLEAGRLLASVKADAAIGVADRDGLSAGIAHDIREGGPRLVVSDATVLFARLRAKADPAEIALAARAAAIAHRALGMPAADDAPLAQIIAAVEGEARGLGAEEIYLAAVPDLARDRRFKRMESETAPGASFALRATVAYKGAWIRLARTFFRDGDAATIALEAAARFADAVAGLPGERGFSGFSSWLVEGCRVAQPLEPLMGVRISEPHPLAPGMLVSVQASFAIGGRPVLLAAPALVGQSGEEAGVLVHPIFD
jgi:hypothetical protein